MLRLPRVILVLPVVILGLAVFSIVQWQRDSSSSGSAQSELDRINQKRAVNGQPTFGPDDADLGQPNIFTSVPVPSVTISPLPTPVPPACGPISGPGSSAELVAQYGEPRSGCIDGRDGQWIVTTSGRPGEPGAIAILTCPEDDDACLAGRPPSSSATWQVYPGPRAGGIKILAERPPYLVISNGGTQMCFDLTNHEYLVNFDCVTATPEV